MLYRKSQEERTDRYVPATKHTGIIKIYPYSLRTYGATPAAWSKPALYAKLWAKRKDPRAHPSAGVSILSARGNRWILVADDHCSNWVVAKATHNADADTVAEFLYRETVLQFGIPTEILSDRGAQFTSEMLAHPDALNERMPSRRGPHHVLIPPRHRRFTRCTTQNFAYQPTIPHQTRTTTMTTVTITCTSLSGWTMRATTAGECIPNARGIQEERQQHTIQAQRLGLDAQYCVKEIRSCTSRSIQDNLGDTAAYLPIGETGRDIVPRARAPQ